MTEAYRHFSHLLSHNITEQQWGGTSCEWWQSGNSRQMAIKSFLCAGTYVKSQVPSLFPLHYQSMHRHVHTYVCVRTDTCKHVYNWKPHVTSHQKTNEDGLRTMVMQMKDSYRLDNCTWWKKKGMKKWQLTGPEPATFRSIANPLAAKPRLLPASIDPFHWHVCLYHIHIPMHTNLYMHIY